MPFGRSDRRSQSELQLSCSSEALSIPFHILIHIGHVFAIDVSKISRIDGIVMIWTSVILKLVRVYVFKTVGRFCAFVNCYSDVFWILFALLMRKWVAPLWADISKQLKLITLGCNPLLIGAWKASGTHKYSVHQKIEHTHFHMLCSTPASPS